MDGVQTIIQPHLDRIEEQRESVPEWHFGEHLTIDGYGGDFDLLNTEALVEQSVYGLPEKLGMKILGHPIVYGTPGNRSKDPGGWTAVVTIEESHISIHTFPRRGFVSIDVYTCRNGMDCKLILEYFVELFRLETLEVNFLIRGTDYPKENLH